MTIQAGYLINHCTINTSNSGPMLLKAGSLFSDPTTLAAIAAAGGQTAPATDAFVLAAVTIVQKMRTTRGDASEQTLDSIMTAAVAASAEALKFVNESPTINASATIAMTPDPSPRAGALVGGTAAINKAPGAGESAVVQWRKNGSNITGATLTFNNTYVANTATAIPSLAGVTYAVGDQFDYTVTYTAGAGNLAGADFNAQMQGQP